MAQVNARLARKYRHRRVRAKVMGTVRRPRLCVFRGLKHIYAQLVDDSVGHTLASASTLGPEIRNGREKCSKMGDAELVGTLVAKRALEKGITQVVFDRAGYKYHGRVRALAEAARQAGLKF